MLSHYSLLLTKAKKKSAPTTPVMILFLGRLVRKIGPWVGVQLEGDFVLNFQGLINRS